MASHWSDLPSPLLELIACKLPTDDLIDFGETCSSWRKVVLQLRGSFRPRISVPWLMITHQERHNLCGFFSPRRQGFYEFPLPPVRGRSCLSSRGWIMTVGKDGDIQMFNPLSRLRACELSRFNGYIGKFVLSACPFSPEKSQIMVLWADYDVRMGLGLWDYRDQAWITVNTCRIFMDLIYHKGRFLAVDVYGTIRAFHGTTDGPNLATDGVVVARKPYGLIDLKHLKKHYLVECWGSLLVVTQELEQWVVTSGFRVFLVDLEASTWIKLESLGNMSLFLGLNSSFSMDVSDQHRGIEPNCIYFTDDCMYKDTVGQDKGIYHMADGRIEPFFHGMPGGRYATPLWIESGAE